MPSTDFKGTYTALATPFDQEKIDYKDLEALVEHQIKGGITGLVAVGTTGESPTLSILSILRSLYLSNFK